MSSNDAELDTATDTLALDSHLSSQRARSSTPSVANQRSGRSTPKRQCDPSTQEHIRNPISHGPPPNIHSGLTRLGEYESATLLNRRRARPCRIPGGALSNPPPAVRFPPARRHRSQAEAPVHQTGPVARRLGPPARSIRRHRPGSEADGASGWTMMTGNASDALCASL